MLIKSLLLVVLLAFTSEINANSEDVEVIFLPSTDSSSEDVVPLEFTVFGHTIDLKLEKNHKLLAPSFRVWRHEKDRNIEEVPELSDVAPCHYLHRDNNSTAAISLCEEGVINGLVLLDNIALEITPLMNEPKSLNFLDHIPIEGQIEKFLKKPHVVKRSHLSSVISNDTQPSDSFTSGYINFVKKLSVSNELFARSGRGREDNDLTIELAVFFDEAAYNIFSPFFNRNEMRIRDMLLAYINGVQALYHHPSLGAKIDIALVRLELMRRQPTDLPHYDGERGDLLESFCKYSQRHNSKEDDDPYHWDMGLYVSGLDFYAKMDGSKVTMGLAPVDGICLDTWSCVIAELGVTNRFGKPYPSAGFTSIYIAAHEIGHNLGMRHDSVDNSCSKDGFIMSPSRGTEGETIWSPCSKYVALKLYREKPCLWDAPLLLDNDQTLNHSRFLELPGRNWTSKKQCELLLRDKDASPTTLTNMCKALQCKTPHRSGYYFAGPALDGTLCAEGKECRGGECLTILQISQSHNPPPQQKPEVLKGWSKWSEEPCQSGCIKKSVGSRERRRVCREPLGKKTKSSCPGLAHEALLCSDDKICDHRVDVLKFAALKCLKLGEFLSELDVEGGGLQAQHEITRPWMACSVFCKRRDIAAYYTPRIELNDLNLDPYFPDGTWCHNEDDEDYFCRMHHCLPKNLRFSKDSFSKYDNNEDLVVGPQNAMPGELLKIPEELVKYLSLGIDGQPLAEKLPERFGTTPGGEDEWSNKDYFEIPVDPDRENDQDDLGFKHPSS